MAVTGRQRGAYQVLIEALGIKDITWLKPEEVMLPSLKWTSTVRPSYGYREKISATFRHWEDA